MYIAEFIDFGENLEWSVKTTSRLNEYESGKNNARKSEVKAEIGLLKLKDFHGNL